ncbi:transporter [Aquincola tertiaricarbonis]|uniref:Transporter n=1 Tax=Aquincola tertiaricarbonis TaxID=391953 RepID=A0ABY4S5Q9_AQUTE|nr:transporter [Aquincola tertiaricarbonis]URI08761.1 transporter [Aquincola tertiaricarbonis]
MNLRLRATAAASCALLGLASAPAHAVDVDAGDYTALPAGTTLGLAYYQHAERNRLYAGGDRVPIDAGLSSDVGILRVVHFMKLGGITIDPQFLLPVARLRAKDDLSALGKDSGVGDLMLAATAWLINDPQTKTYFGITPFVWVPTGAYDRGQGVNVGENRWKWALQAGYIRPLGPQLTLDAAADVTWHGRNDDYGPGSLTLRQKPVVQLQGWLRWHASDALDWRLGLSHTAGGEQSIDGESQHNRLATTRFALGAGYFVGPRTQLLATVGRDLRVREGLRESGRVNLRLLQIF